MRLVATIFKSPDNFAVFNLEVESDSIDEKALKAINEKVDDGYEIVAIQALYPDNLLSIEHERYFVDTLDIIRKLNAGSDSEFILNAIGLHKGSILIENCLSNLLDSEFNDSIKSLDKNITN